MTSVPVVIVGRDGLGSQCVRVPLGHGAAPRDVLAAAGWDAQELLGIGHSADGVAVVFRVRREKPHQPPAPTPRVTVSPELARTAVRHQRVSAYALVESSRGVLLTEFSEQTARAGSWGLPGGGLDPGEAPDAAAQREVWEETGQSMALDGPRDVVIDHWVGAAPDGRIEDFHAVRLVYHAHCSAPSDPVVHDVGGTTRSAAWWPRAQLARLDLTPWTRAQLTTTGG